MTNFVAEATDKRPNIAILSGEMSGDLVGGALAHVLRAKRPDLELWGIGSRHMQEAGTALLYDSAEWSAIGVVEALKIYPRLRLTAYPHVLREIDRRKPHVVILIDFGAFNSKVARWCKQPGAAGRPPVLWYFPPGSWRKDGRANAELAQITDRIATPFPWSEERLRSLGANAEFVGHPLLEIVKPAMTRARFADRYGMEPGKPIIGLLPGSRGFEVTYNTPAMLGAAHAIAKAIPDAQFVIGLASPRARERVEKILNERHRALAQIARWAGTTHPDEAAIQRALERLEERLGLRTGQRMVTPEGIIVSTELLRDGRDREARRQRAEAMKARFELPPVVLAENLTYDVMAHSDALLVCSGTATLEAALLGAPMAILYRGSRLMEWEAKLRQINPEHMGMPNIIAGKRVVPEFLQRAASPEALAEAILRILPVGEARAEMQSALHSVREALLPPGGNTTASERTADIALELAGLL